MVRNGFNPKKVKQRMTRYRKCLTHPGACIAIVQKYKDEVSQAELAAMNANDSQRASSSRASQRAEAGRPPQSVEALMEAIREFGRLPKESRGATEEEQKLAVRLMNAKRRGHLSEKRASQRAEARRPRQSVEALMEEIRKFKRLAKESRGATEKERKLAMRLRDAKRAGDLSDEHKVELATMSAKEAEPLEEVDVPPDPKDPFADEAANRLEQDLLMVKQRHSASSLSMAPGGGASQVVAPGGGAWQPVAPIESRRRPRFETLMEAIREFGRLPKESRTASKVERSLAMRLRDAKRKGGNLSDEHKAELAAMSAKELGSLEEVDLPPDHTDRFADMAGNRLEQDLLMVMNGTNRKKVLQRMIRYKKYLTHPGACIVIVEKYKDKVFQAEREHRLAMSAASRPAPPGATKSRASRSCASLPPSRKAKRSRHAVGGA